MVGSDAGSGLEHLNLGISKLPPLFVLICLVLFYFIVFYFDFVNFSSWVLSNFYLIYVFKLIFAFLQFFIIFFVLIFTDFVQILKPGLKISKQQNAGKFSQL